MQISYNLSVRFKIVADMLVMLAVLVLTGAWSLQPDINSFNNNTLLTILLCMTCWFFTARWIGLYKDFRAVKFSFEWIIFLKALILYSLVISFIFFQFLNEHPLPGSHLALHCGLLFIFIPLQKVVTRMIFKRLRSSKQVNRKVLIVGAGDSGQEFYRQYVQGNHYGFSLTGFIDDNVNSSLNGQYLGKASDIDRVVAEYELDEIVVAMPIRDESQMKKIVAVGEREGKRVRIIPHYQGFSSGKIHVGTLGTLPIITLRSLPLDVIDNKIYKRIFDIVFSSLVIICLLSWLVPIIAVLIKLTSKGPVFFRQERWGLNNASMTCYKFRTMRVDSKDVDESGAYQQARKNDPRVTKIGAFLRKSSIDELPQFFNVLFGSMSVVGPRPHPVPLNIQSKDSVENYMMRHWVKPGITGWAQVNGYRGETHKAYLMQKRVEFDLWYMENWTFWLDLQITLQTLVNTVKREKNAY